MNALIVEHTFLSLVDTFTAMYIIFTTDFFCHTVSFMDLKDNICPEMRIPLA